MQVGDMPNRKPYIWVKSPTFGNIPAPEVRYHTPRGKGAKMNALNTEKARRAAEEYTDATRESYRIVVRRAFAARESNSRLARDFFEKTIEEIQEQARLNLLASQELSEHARRRGKALGLFEGPAEVHKESLVAPPENLRE